MDGVREGHKPSLAILVDQYWSPLVAYAAGIIGDGDVAQDVVQGTFIQVWRKRSEWEPKGEVSAFLYKITRNLALNARRDSTLRQKRHEQGGGAEFHPRPSTPGEDLKASCLRDEVKDAIAQLTDRRREIFVLSRFSGLSHREIAQMLGISTQTVSNQMSATLEQLRNMLSHHLKER